MGSPQVIEWQHLDKRKYFVLGPTFNLGTLLLLYPTKLIKIRLQAQVGTSLYKGTFDAFGKVIRQEGFRALYKGIGPNSLTILANQLYVTNYEWSKAAATPYCENEAVRNLGAGVLSACVSQFVTVPADVVSQRLMVEGQRNTRSTPPVTTKPLIKQIFVREGWRGFYRGYKISLMTFAPSSGIFWALYGVTRRWQTNGWRLGEHTPSLTYTMLQQAIASAFAGSVSAIATNPLDVIKTNIQLNSLGCGSSITQTAAALSNREGSRWLTKGLSGRILHTATNSVILIVGYETIKYLSLN